MLKIKRGGEKRAFFFLSFFLQSGVTCKVPLLAKSSAATSLTYDFTLMCKKSGKKCKATSAWMIRRWRFTHPNPVIPPLISRTLCLSVSLESTTDKPSLCPHSLILDHHCHRPLSILHVLRGGGLLGFLLRDPSPYLSTTLPCNWPGAVEGTREFWVRLQSLQCTCPQTFRCTGQI